MSLYQAFAILWHLDRGDTDAARLVASLPPQCFAGLDDMMQAAVVLGMAQPR